MANIQRKGTDHYDATVVGSGPNGLTAAICLAQAGHQVLLLEMSDTIGGGTRSGELTLPGFVHDICSAAHPTGAISPIFNKLGVEQNGLRWIYPKYSAAHPLDRGETALLSTDIEETIASLDAADRSSYRKKIGPLLNNFDSLFGQLLQMHSLKKDYLAHIRFGVKGILPATKLSSSLFKETKSRALFAGCAAHSILPLDFWGTGAVGLVFLLSGHSKGWPIAAGGSQSIANSLRDIFLQLGGEIRTGFRVDKLADIPRSRKYVFDLSPAQIAEICGDELSSSYRRQLGKFNYGPGVYKVDYALSQEIPWQDERCNGAGTVHVGGTFEEISVGERETWGGKHSQRPFVMVCQQSNFDPSRTPDERRTGYAYCHVPNGSDKSMRKEIEAQIERFAPGFKDCILECKETTAKDFSLYNPSYLGGAITGGANTLSQLITRPTLSLQPYRTSNHDIYICSHSTPPGGGVHGMCGYNAAKIILRDLKRA